MSLRPPTLRAGPGPSSNVLEWLKLRHLIDKTANNILDEKTPQIFEVLGGIKAHLKWLLWNPSNVGKNTLLSLIAVLQEKEPNKTDSSAKNEDKTDDDNEKMQIFNLQSVPHDLTSYLCTYLTLKEIHSLQLSCTDLAYICLNEMKKSDIGVINFNQLIGKEIIDLGIFNELIHNYRMYRNDTLSHVFNKWMDIYDIPWSKAMFRPLRVNGRSYRPSPTTPNMFSKIVSLNYNNYILFDLRNIYTLGVDNITSNTVFGCLILKYFDIEKQKLYVVGSVAVYFSTLLDLVTIIMDKVIIDHIEWECFQRLQCILNEMSILDAYDIKLLLYRERSVMTDQDGLQRAIPVASNAIDYTQDVFRSFVPGDVAIFQLNHCHCFFMQSISQRNNANYMTDNFDVIRFSRKDRKYVAHKDNNEYGNNTLFDLEKQYTSRGLNMYYLVSDFIRYKEEFRNIKLIFRYSDKWKDVLSSIMRLNKGRNKIIAAKYHKQSIHFEVNIHTTYNEIRKRIGFIYGIDYDHIELWIPRSVIHYNTFEYTHLYRAVHSDLVGSFFKSKYSNFMLPLKWEICAYSTLKYDQIMVEELDKIQAPMDAEYMDTGTESMMSSNLAIYRIVLVSPNMNTMNNNKYVDVIYDNTFDVNVFIKYILSIIYKQEIVCDEYSNVYNVLSQDMDVISNGFVVSVDNGKQCLSACDGYSLPSERSAIDIERNTYHLQQMCVIENGENSNQYENAMMFKFWKYVNNEYKVCGMIFKVNVTAKDNLKDIIEKQLKQVITSNCKFYLSGSKNAQYLGSLIERNTHRYFYPYTILLQDGNACLNVLCAETA